MTIYELLLEINKLPQLSSTETKVLITVFSPEFQRYSVNLAKELRNEQISTELFLDSNKGLDKQFKYADKKGIPYIIVIGPEEMKNSSFVLKNLKESEQTTVNYAELLQILKNR